MNNTNTYLRFKSKFNLVGIRNSIKNGNVSYQGSFIESGKQSDGQVINLVLKNHTNYLSICTMLWQLPKDVVCKELDQFYKSIIKLDPSLAPQCEFGLLQHMGNYAHHNNKAKQQKA
jgi:hypothetical protein